MAQNTEFLYQLRMANPIETIFGNYFNLKRQGHNYVCNCPFHSEKSPSCTVFIDTQSFYCFGCGVGGDVVTFIMKYENLSFYEAVKFLAERSGLQMPANNNADNRLAQRKNRIYEMNRLAANFFYLNLVKGSDKSGLKYFVDRKLLPETVKKYGLGFASNSWDELYRYLSSKGFSDDEMMDAWLCSRSNKNGRMYDIFRNRVIFPIVDLRGNIIGFGGRVLDDSKPKYLNTNKTPVFDKGKNLFSLNFAKNSSVKKIILTEGYMDVIALNQAGFTNVVATLGTAITQNHALLIRQYCEQVIICYDNDSAGQNAAKKAINILSEAGVPSTIIRMEDAKDPDEYIKKFGTLKFKMLVDSSVDANAFMLDKCTENLDMNTEQGKVEFIKRAVKVLVEISNPLERDIYISRTVEKSGVSKEILQTHIQNELLKNNKNISKKQWRDTVNKTYRLDSMIPDEKTHNKESKAEEEIIRYLLKFPEEAKTVSSQISPDEFVTDFYKRAFESLIGKMLDTDKFTISMLADEFSSEELSKIIGIEAQNRNVDINSDVLLDCINVLKDYQKKSFLKSQTVPDDAGLAELFKNAKR